MSKEPEGRHAGGKRARSKSASTTAAAKGSAQSKGAGDEAASGSAPALAVCLAASVSGLDTLEDFFRSLPATDNLAFVLVLHADAVPEQGLGDWLSQRCSLPVREVEQPCPLRPGCLYFATPGCWLELREGWLYPDAERAEHEDDFPLDHFLCSLAEDRQEYAVAVVLSGSGVDSCRGLRDIKAQGGLVLVQDPQETLFKGMPAEAIDSGQVDLILPSQRIAPTLASYARHAIMEDPLTAQVLQNAERDFLRPIIQLLRERSDYDFRRYRKNTLLRRIQRRMGLKQVEELSDYLLLLRDNRQELLDLARDLLIGVTAFFRDREAWEILEAKVLPALFEDYQGQALRVWVPGCASGEEAYTLAILLHEQAARQGRVCRCQIFATDIAEDALDVGRQGLYAESIARDLTPDRLQRWFTREQGGYRVSKVLRESVVFASQNVLSQPPFSRLDLISCRNLLIYLEPDAQKRLLSIFQFALKEGRFLFLGSSESLGDKSDHFTALSRKWRLYRRNAMVTLPRLDFPSSALGEPRGAEARRRPPHLAERVAQQLLGESEAALAVINEDNRVVLLQGATDAYLQLPSGELLPQLPNLIEVCREGLRSRLRVAIQQARRHQGAAEQRARVRHKGQSLPCRLLVRPLHGSDSGERCLLVSFLPLPAAPTSPAPGQPGEEASPSDANLRELELELQTTREELNSTIEQLETANEELKASHEEAMATNEELQSTNEELETSKEELQSLNEELNSLNHQLESKLEQLQLANNDLANLFASSPVATLFLDTRQCIRRFTPACTALFHLIPSDIGRPLADIATRCNDEDLLADADAVLRDLQPRDHQVGSESGHSYLRRILPYRSEDNRIEGVVITFSDVTRLEDLTRRLRARERQHAALAQLGQQALSQGSLDGLLDSAVRMAADVLGTEFCKIMQWEARSDCLFLRAGTGWRSGLVGELRTPLGEDSQAALAMRSKTPVIVEDLVADPRFRAPALLLQHGVTSGMSVLIQGTREPFGVLGVHTARSVVFNQDDMNFLQSLANVLGEAAERAHMTEALAKSERRFRQVVDNIAQLAWTADQLGFITWYNRRWYEYTGTCYEEMREHGWSRTIHPDHLARVRQRLEQSASAREAWEDTFPIRRHDGVYRWFLSRAQPILDERGEVTQWFGTNTDISERMEMEEALKEADRRKDDFLATLAHELRNPLAPIRSGLQVLPQADAQQREQIYRIMERQTNQLVRLVDELMDVSRITRGKVSLRKQFVTLEEVLKGALEAIHALLEQKEHRCEVRLPGEDLLLYADPVRLTQVFLNLLSNAAHYTAAGGHIQVEACVAGNSLDVTIKDNGIGMQAEAMQRIFEAFVQIESPLTKSQSGLGIGLTLARSLVEMHNGRIHVSSEGLGKGTCFTVSLPLANTQAELEPLPHERGTEGVSRSRRVLVVDDNADAAATLGTLLRLQGHEVRVLFDGDAALAEGGEFQPQVVLLDLGMPGRNGLDTAREIRALPWGRDITLVAITGWGQDHHRRETMEAGFNMHLVKPVTLEQLGSLFEEQREKV